MQSLKEPTSNVGGGSSFLKGSCNLTYSDCDFARLLTLRITGTENKPGKALPIKLTAGVRAPCSSKRARIRKQATLSFLSFES